MRLFALTLPYAASSATRARRALVEQLHGLVPPELVSDAELALSEMVGNAVRHARPRSDGSLLARWEVEDSALRIAVIDGGADSIPAAREPNYDEGGGRGLAIVAAIASDWGVNRAGSDTTVWAEFAW